MRDVFAAMPDSVLGIMTKNNRLDCIDFIENDMEAKVRNRFDGFSVLKALTVDYLDLQLTPNCRVEMKLLPAEDTLNYICVARTYSGPVTETKVALYAPDWNVLPEEKWIPFPAYADFWETEKGKECISEFDQVLPDYKGISKIKKIDSILWSIR